MTGGDRLVPRDSATYLEFARLYRLARSLRPTSVDRWNGVLRASDSESSFGGFNPRTGTMRLSGSAVLPYLSGAAMPEALAEQAQALATVIHETTHASVETDDPAEPNAVRSVHSRGLMEGVAELRAVEDFRLFTRQAGYFGLSMPQPQYEGAYTATDSLVSQVAGPRRDRVSIINDLARGPAVAHFDRLAQAVVQNRLWEQVPHLEDHQRAARAALIPTMTHELWPGLHDERATTGHYVAEQVRQALNAKVDEIRRHYLRTPFQPFPATPLQTAIGSAPPVHPPAQQEDVPAELRFLSGLVPAAGAVRGPVVLGEGRRRVVDKGRGWPKGSNR